jgi:hypothetical protein
MARFTYTKTVEHYSFNPPTSISEEEFNVLKIKIMKNPEAPLTNENAQQKSHDNLSTILLIGVVFLVTGLFGMFAFDEPQWWGVLLTILSTFGVLHPAINMGQMESSKNRLKAEQDRILFYRELKEMIRKSNSHKEFCVFYQFKYGHFFT